MRSRQSCCQRITSACFSGVFAFTSRPNSVMTSGLFPARFCNRVSADVKASRDSRYTFTARKSALRGMRYSVDG